MLKTIFLALALCATPLHAETLPPGAVQIRDAAGNKVGTTNEGGGVISVNAHITNPGGASTVTANQGTAGGSPWPVTGPLTDTQLRATPVPVSGTISGSLGRSWTLLNTTDSVNVGNFPVTQAVTGTFFQATQPVSGSMGRTWSLLNTTDSVNVGNFPSTQAVTGTFFQATQPVSIAAPVAVTGTFFQATQPVSGTITANAGTNLNTSALALESGGHLASLDSKAPSLGQALAAGSVPVVLPAAQITTLTPPTTVTVTQATGTNLHAVVDSGTVTANAGTNLNTSALALESGGHLASIDTKVATAANQSTANTSLAAIQASVANIPASPATAGNQTTANSSLATIATNTTGASTAANQTTANSSLSSIVTNTTGLALQSGTQNNLDKSGSGTIASALDTVTATTNGAASCTFNTSGTFSAVLIFVGSTNGVSSPVASTPFTTQGAALSLFLSSNTTVVIPTGGMSQMVVKAFSYTSGTATINWECGSGTNIGFAALATAAQASSTTVGSVSLGNSTGKVNKSTTGTLTSTAVTANQTILTYTVTAGKTLYLEEFDCGVSLNSAAATQTQFGTCSLSINGTIVWTQFYKGPGSGSFMSPVTYSEPIPVAAGQVVLIETTPSAATSFLWYGNIGGYEK